MTVSRNGTLRTAAWLSASGTSATSGAFTPTAGCGYLVSVNIGSSSGSITAPAVTWATGGTGALWGTAFKQLMFVAPGSSEPAVALFWSYIPVGASPGSSTIAASNTGGKGLYATVDEITGADPINPTGISAQDTTGTAESLTETAQQTGSLCYCSCEDFFEAQAVSAATGNTIISQSTGISGQTCWFAVNTTTTTAGSGTTAGSATTASGNTLAYIEIIPAAVAVTEDIGSPTPTGSTTTLPAAQSYTPPLANMTVTVMLNLRSASNSACTGSVSDGTNTYSLLKRANGIGTSLGGTSEVWAYTYSSAPGALTITPTAATGTVTGGAMVVKGLYNTSTTPGTTETKDNTTAAALDIAGSPLVAGGRVYGAAIRSGSSTAPTVSTATVSLSALAETGTVAYSCNAFKSAALTTTSSTTYGYTTSTIGHVVWAEMQVASSGPVEHFQTLTAGLSFTGAEVKATAKTLAAATLSFTGSLARLIAHILTAGLSFTGTQSRAVSKALTAGLSFIGAQARAVAKGITAGASFTGSLAKAVTRQLTAGLSFTGSLARSLPRLLTAGLSFTGAQSRGITKSVTAGLSFAGGQVKAVTKTLAAAGISFAGSLAKQFTRTFNAGLSFTGALSKRAGKLLTAGLSFTGAQSRAMAKVMSAGLSFTGSQTRAIAKGMTAGLSLSGALVKSVAKTLTAGLSFVGSLTSASVHHYTQSFSASLSFTGSQSRAISKQLTAGLSFTGSFVKAVRKTVTAGLSFTGNLARAIRKGLSAGLSFAGSLAKMVAHALSAGLSFTGNLATAAVHFYTKTFTATLSFTGSQTKAVSKTLTAAGLSFSGALSKATSKTLSAGLSFAGTCARAIKKGLTATLSFTGGLIKAIAKKLTAGLSFVGSLSTGSAQRYFQTFTASLGFTGATTKSTSKQFSAGLSFAGSIGKRIGKALQGVLSFLGDLVPTKHVTPQPSPPLVVQLAPDWLQVQTAPDWLTAEISGDWLTLTVEGTVAQRNIRASIGNYGSVTAILTATTNVDITADTVKLGLGTTADSDGAPSSWYTPTAVNTQAWQRVLTLSVGAGQTPNPSAGTYYVWVQDTGTGYEESVPDPSNTVIIS